MVNEFSELLSSPTPFYYYDFDKVNANLLRLYQYFNSSNTEIFYSVKTNDCPLLLEFLKSKGIYVEVASGLELQLAREIGFEKILFNGPAKTKDELKLATMQKDTIVIVDNLCELGALQGALSSRIDIGIRINFSQCEQYKFGIHKRDISTALEIIYSEKNLTLIGFHFFLGNSTNSSAHYKYIFGRLLSIVKSLPSDYFKDINFIDIGGGIPCRGKIKRTLFEKSFTHYAFKYSFIDKLILSKELGYIKKIKRFKLDNWLSKYSKIVKYYMRRLENLLNKKLTLYLEPGTAIIGDAVDIYSKVIVNKHRKVLIDVGMNECGRFWNPIYNISNPSVDIQTEYVFGPLCTPYDLFTRCYVGQPLKKGDWVKILSMGAYTFSFHTSFIKPQLAVVIKKHNKIEKVTDTETLQYKYGAFFRDNIRKY